MKKLRTIFYIVVGFASMALLASVMFAWTFGWAFADTAAYTSSPVSSGYSTNVGYGDDANDYCVIQPFTATASGNLTAISGWFADNSSPGWIPTVEIFSDSAGSPGSLLETGGTLSPSSFVNASSISFNSDQFTQATSTFSGSTPLVSGEQYWIVFSSGGHAAPGLDEDVLLGASDYLSTGGRGQYPCGSDWSELATQNTVAAVVMVGGGGGGGGGGSATSTSPFSYITATTSYAVVDNPTQDFFDGIVCFFLGFLGMVWLLRKH